MAKKNLEDPNIVINRKAGYLYTLEDRYNAGLVLLGWEVKSLRKNSVQLSDAYIVIKKRAAWLINANISPLSSIAKYTDPQPTRSRKLLLTKREINKLFGLVAQKGYSLIPLKLYWHKNFVKLEFAVAKGKKDQDKRRSSQERDWAREKQRYFKKSLR